MPSWEDVPAEVVRRGRPGRRGGHHGRAADLADGRRAAGTRWPSVDAATSGAGDRSPVGRRPGGRTTGGWCRADTRRACRASVRAVHGAGPRQRPAARPRCRWAVGAARGAGASARVAWPGWCSAPPVLGVPAGPGRSGPDVLTPLQVRAGGRRCRTGRRWPGWTSDAVGAPGRARWPPVDRATVSPQLAGHAGGRGGGADRRWRRCRRRRQFALIDARRRGVPDGARAARRRCRWCGWPTPGPDDPNTRAALTRARPRSPPSCASSWSAIVGGRAGADQAGAARRPHGGLGRRRPTATTKAQVATALLSRDGDTIDVSAPDVVTIR